MSIRKNIRLQIHDEIAVIRLDFDDDNAPRNPTPAEQLADACRSLNEAPNIRAVILTNTPYAPTRHSRAEPALVRRHGGGNPSPEPSPHPFWPETLSPSSSSFPAKAGIHLPPSPSMGEGWDGGDSPESTLQRLRVANHVANLKVPTIAAIQGHAWNQGLELALACDLRIAAEDATFGFSSLAEGFIPWDGGTQRLPRIIGRARALDLLLTGRSLNAHEALEFGLVNAVAPAKDLEAAAMNLAQTIANAAPIAVRYLKEAVHKGLDLSLTQGLNLEADLSFILQTTQDRQRGIDSFLNKTTPKFTAQ